MPKAAWYIDGFNLYHSLDLVDETRAYRWLNLRTLAEKNTRPQDKIESVTFFTASPKWNSGKVHRHETYCDALRAFGVEVVMGKFIVVDEECRNDCSAALKGFKKYSEKRTDVHIALRAYSDAALKGIESLYILTADSDQVPTAEMIKSLRGGRRVTFVSPRSYDISELRHHANVTQLGKSSFAGCRLPAKIVRQGHRIIRCPSAWLWDGADPESEVGGL